MTVVGYYECEDCGQRVAADAVWRSIESGSGIVHVGPGVVLCSEHSDYTREMRRYFEASA